MSELGADRASLSASPSWTWATTSWHGPPSGGSAAGSPSWQRELVHFPVLTYPCGSEDLWAASLSIALQNFLFLKHQFFFLIYWVIRFPFMYALFPSLLANCEYFGLDFCALFILIRILRESSCGHLSQPSSSLSSSLFPLVPLLKV